MGREVVVVAGSLVVALVVVMARGTNFAAGAFVFDAVESFVTIFMAREAARGRRFRGGVRTREATSFRSLGFLLQVFLVDDDGVGRGSRHRGSLVGRQGRHPR